MFFVNERCELPSVPLVLEISIGSDYCDRRLSTPEMTTCFIHGTLSSSPSPNTFLMLTKAILVEHV